MSSYRLKPDQPDFEMVDGPFTGRKFEAGKNYSEVPVQEAHRFQETGESTLRMSVTDRKTRKRAQRAESGKEETTVDEQAERTGGETGTDTAPAVDNNGGE
jgi:hypothetical protein